QRNARFLVAALARMDRGAGRRTRARPQDRRKAKFARGGAGLLCPRPRLSQRISAFMHFDPPLLPAVLVQRYKRFLFDAVLEDGRGITGFCPNTGSMRGLTTPGSRIWLSQHESPTRRYRHVLEMVEVAGHVIGINTGL